MQRNTNIRSWTLGERVIKGLLIRLIVLSGSLAVGTGLAEILTRIARPQVTMFPRYITSSEYAYEFPRNATIHNARGNLWSFTYTTNEIGRRGPFVRPATAHDVLNVALLGDSYTFGIGVDDGDVYSVELQNLVGRTWRVVNGGMPGWGIDSEIKWFFQAAADYRPRAVVLQFCANDPWDSNTGVTTVKDGQFEFHPIPASSRKPSWMDWVSRSSVLQRSNLYSLIRSLGASGGPEDFNFRALGGVNSSGPAESSRHTHEQLQYVQYLHTFAVRLHDDKIPLLLVSVTHDTQTGYVYDLSAFPLIEAEVHRLGEDGLMQFIELPLKQMHTYPGSPEGHHWGPKHHRLVAGAVASALGQL
jgi:hypothetical protein